MGSARPIFPGEYLVYDSSDFEVNIKTTQTGVVIAASGVGEPNGEWTRYRINGARTFAFSASDQFQYRGCNCGRRADPLVLLSGL